jgi:hypothetical protein
MRRQAFGERRAGEADAGVRALGRRAVAPVIVEADVGRRSAIERRDIDDTTRLRRRLGQRRAGQGDDLIKRETSRFT